MSDLSDKAGNHISNAHIKLYRQEYVYLRTPSPYSTEPPGWWPDPLVPFLNPYDAKPISAMRLNRVEENGKASYQLSGARFAGNGFTVWPGRNQPLWGDVMVPANQHPGDYEGTFSVQLTASDKVEIPVKLTVWDFALPDGLSLTTQFGSLDGVSAKHGVPDGAPQSLEIQERYAAALQEHRIAAPIPSALLPTIRPSGSIDTKKNHEALKGYLTQHRTGPFRIPVFPGDGKGKKAFVRYLHEVFAYLKENGWERGAYYFPFQNLTAKRLMTAFGPSLNWCMRPNRASVFYAQNNPILKTRLGETCMEPWIFGVRSSLSSTARKRHEPENAVKSFGPIQHFVRRPLPYHPNFAAVGGEPGMFWQIDFPLLNYRLPLWLSWRNKIEGLLYWSAVHWGDPQRDVWTDPAFRNRYNARLHSIPRQRSRYSGSCAIFTHQGAA